MKKSVMLIGLTVLAMIIGGVIVHRYYLINTGHPSAPTNSHTTNTNQPNLFGWKTYTNNELGFSFQYPPNLQLWDNLETGGPGTWHAVRLIYTVDENNNFDVFDIATATNPSNLSAAQYLKQQIVDGKNCDGPCGMFSRFVRENQIQSGSNVFFGITGGFTGEVPSDDIYYISHGSKLFAITIANFSGAEGDYKDEVAVSNQMYQVLDTLKFTK